MRKRGGRCAVFGKEENLLIRCSGRGGLDAKARGDETCMWVLDTNILVYHAAGDETTVAFFDEHKSDVFYVPSIVVAEFLSYPLITEAAIRAFKSFTSQTIIVNLDFSIAEFAAELRRMYRVKLIDAVVAATALTASATLVTKNIRDFRNINGLKLFDLVS